MNILKHQITDLLLTSHTTPETTLEEQTCNVEPLYTRQQSEQSEQEDLINLFQNPDPPQDQPLYPPISQIPDIQQPNPSETTTIHDPSEISEKTVQNTRSFTITDDSNIILFPTHNITQNEFNNQNQDNPFTTNPDNTSVLSTSNTIIHNLLRHKYHLPEVIIHLLFHLNSQLK